MRVTGFAHTTFNENGSCNTRAIELGQGQNKRFASFWSHYYEIYTEIYSIFVKGLIILIFMFRW
jgi:hypothetical protein